MTHHHLRFKLSGEVQSNTDYDYDSGTAEGHVHTGYRTQNDGQDSQDCEEQCTNQSDLVDNFGDECCGGFSGTDAGDGTVVLLKVVCHFNGIVLDRNIEIVKCYNEDEVQYGIDPRVERESLKELIPESSFFESKESADCCGDRYDGIRRTS